MYIKEYGKNSTSYWIYKVVEDGLQLVHESPDYIRIDSFTWSWDQIRESNVSITKCNMGSINRR